MLKSIISVVLLIEISQAQVLLLDQETILSAIKDFPNLIIYFGSEQCQYCKDFNLTFTIVAAKYQKLYPGEAQFGKIMHTKKTSKIFSELEISTVPQVKYFNNGSKSSIEYEWLEYDESSAQILIKWIRLGLKGIPSIKNTHEPTCSDCDRLVVRCSLAQKLRYLSQYYLQMNFECIQDIPDHEIVYFKGSTYKKTIKCSDSQECIEKISRIKKEGVHQWDHSFIYELFNKNQSFFVLIVNNDELSDKMLSQYSQIKQRWDKQELKKPSFAIADAFTNVQQASKIKAYIGGYSLSGYIYPFPLLAYLRNVDGQIHKYIYEKKTSKGVKSNYTVEEWMNRVLNNEQQRYFKGEEDQDHEMEDDEEIRQFGRVLKSSYQEVNQVLKKTNLPLVTLYVWRYQLEILQFAGKVKQWWKSSKLNKKYLFHMVNSFFYDTPSGIVLKSLPAIVVYGEDRIPEKHEGISSLEQLEDILNEFEKRKMIKK